MLFICCAGLLSHSVQAHEFWLQPTNYHVQTGSLVSIGVFVGQNYRGDSLPYIPAWVERFEAISKDRAVNIAGAVGDDPAGRLPIAAPGQYVVSYLSQPQSTDIDLPKFKQYLHEAGIEHLVTEQQLHEKALIHEQFIRCAKTIIDAGGEGPVTEPTGLRLEIVPLSNPYRLKPGQSLPIKILFDSAPLAGALVAAFPRGGADKPYRVRTDQAGIAHIPLRAEEWLLSVVHLVRIGGVTDWMSYWGSLTFKLK